MKTKRTMAVFTACVAVYAVSMAASAEPPLMMMRLRGPHTADDTQWAKTFKALSDNRAACDEVWFSTGVGFPKMEWHEAHVKRLVRYAEQPRGVHSCSVTPRTSTTPRRRGGRGCPIRRALAHSATCWPRACS